MKRNPLRTDNPRMGRFRLTRLTRLTAVCTLMFAGPMSIRANAAPSSPITGLVIFNEFNSVNDGNGNDYFELLVIKDGLDLRGLRVTNNELRRDRLNNGEAVYIFDQAPYLESVPKGTTIAVWTSSSGVALDIAVDPKKGDWKLALAPGTGVNVGTDGLGGTVKTGLKSEDQLYLYLAGPDGSSAGIDNVYLDFISWDESNAASSPGGSVSSARAPDGAEAAEAPKDRDDSEGIELPAPAAYLVGQSCTALLTESGRNWSIHNKAPGAAPSTPGMQNVNQDLNNCRAATVVVPLGDPKIGLSGLGLLGAGIVVAAIRRRKQHMP
jgi:hypothetical protein